LHLRSISPMPKAMGLLLAAFGLLLACPVLGVEVVLRRELLSQHVDELSNDELFSMTWASQTSLDHTALIASVENDNCTSFSQNSTSFVCHIESPEHVLVRKWIPADATVMEFGARFGTTTCEIARKLENSGRLVSIEPDSNAWDWLESNVKAHNCHSHVLRGAVSGSPTEMLASGYGGQSLASGSTWKSWIRSKLGLVQAVPTFTFDDVEKASGLKFDTLLIDCEGCAQDLMDQIGPKIQSQINLVVIEADMPDVAGSDCTSHCMDYNHFFAFLKDSGFEKVDEFNDCDRKRSEAPDKTWCGTWINHYAFRRIPNGLKD